jgi:ankyrin repeat protein
MRSLPIFLCFAFGLQAQPLFDAIQQADTPAVKRLLASGVSADSRDADGVPAVMSAVLFARADCVKLLLDRGADPNAANKTGSTALMWAVPDLEKVKLLVEHGADVNARSNNLGRTPLLIAAGYPGSTELLRFLLDKGADLHAKDKNGEHALNKAASRADVEVVRFLVERGMDVNEPGSSGGLPLSRAMPRSYLPSVEFLLDRGAKIRKQDLIFATHWVDPKILEKVLAMDVDVNARQKPFGRTPLINATASEQAGALTLKLLLEKGADPNMADDDGETALNWAMHRADRAKIDVLKQYGAKLGTTVRNKDYPKPEGVADARASLARSAALLQAIGSPMFQKHGCITCHNQSMPAQVASAARERGLAVNEDLAKKNLKQILAVYKPKGDEAMQGLQPAGTEITVGYIVMALAAEKYPLDKTTAALTHVIAAAQMPDGSWPNTISRPPMEDSSITGAAMAVRALTLYPIEGAKQEIDQKLRRARTWLLAAKPQSAEEYAMRLMGLAWTAASRHEVDAAAEEWIAQQRAAGGWSQVPHFEPDAYATGITLYALHEAGIPVTHPAYQKGVRFLLVNQHQDGSWFVRTRSFPVQPQMESGYPFGYNQWISAAGASWASLAIAYTLPNNPSGVWPATSNIQNPKSALK